MATRRWSQTFPLVLLCWAVLFLKTEKARASICSIQLLGDESSGTLLTSYAQSGAGCKCWEDSNVGRGAIVEYPYANSGITELCGESGFAGGLFGFSNNSNAAIAVRPWWRAAVVDATSLKFSGADITLDGGLSHTPTAADLDLTTNGPTMPLLYFSNVSNLLLRNLVFRNLTSSGPVILLEGCTNVTLQNITFEDVTLSLAGFSTGGLIRAVSLLRNQTHSLAAATGTGVVDDILLSSIILDGVTVRRAIVSDSITTTSDPDDDDYDDSDSLPGALITLSRCYGGCTIQHTSFDGLVLTKSWSAVSLHNLSSAKLYNISVSNVGGYGPAYGISISGARDVTANHVTVTNANFGGPDSIIDASAFNIRDSANVSLARFTCNGCSSGRGPCLTASSSSVTVMEGSFARNTAAISGFGGVICLVGVAEDISTDLQIADSVFEGNNATYGGAIALQVQGNRPVLSLTVDHSTFRDNNAYPAGPSDAFGGDIYVVDGGSLSVTATSFINSTATGRGSNGGSIYSHRARVSVSSSNFTGCSSRNRGGAIYHEPVAEDCTNPTSCSLSLDTCHFEQSTAGEGGAVLYLLNDNAVSAFDVSGCVFTSNWADYMGGAISMPGSCEPYKNDACKLHADPASQGLTRFLGCQFRNNSALRGGAVYYAYNNAQGLRVTSSQFLGNHASDTGGLYARAVPVVEIADSLFADNTATLIGAAGVFSLHSHALIHNATFRNNSCNEDSPDTGSALYVAEYDGVTEDGTEAGDLFSVTLTNSTFEDNFSSSEAGGATLARCNAHLEDVLFRGNAAARKGGALYLEPDVGGVLVAVMDGIQRRVTAALLRRVRFQGNRATTSAGALLMSGWQLQLEDVEFVNNSASTFAAGGADNSGGAMTATNCPGTVEMWNVAFSLNRAYQGGALMAELCNMTLHNATFTGNSARGDAGAVLVSGFTSQDFTAESWAYAFQLHESKFEQNTAGGIGGAIKAYWAVMKAADIVFTNNSASIQGGAVYLQIVPPMPHTDSGAAMDTGARAVFSRCVFRSNAVSNSGGALFHSVSAVQLTDCKMYDNTAGNGGYFTDTWSNAGGAIFGMSCTAPMLLSGSYLGGNTADGRGGAVALLSCGASLEGSSLYGNIARLSGGGVSAGNQVTRAQPEGPELLLSNCSFSSNAASDEHGGAVHATSVRLTMRDSTVVNSTARLMGGGLYGSAAAHVVISNCTLSGNRAGVSGGALWAEASGLVQINKTVVDSNSAYDSGGGLGLLNTNCTYVAHVQLSGNSAARGGGSFVTMPSLTQHSLTVGGLPCIAAFSKLLGTTWVERLTNGSQAIVAKEGGAFNLLASDLTAQSNRALTGQGGALLLEATRGSVLLDAFYADSNAAGAEGGAVAMSNIRADDTILYISSSVFNGNNATTFGGALAMDGSWAHQQLFLSNSSMQRNRAASGGALCLSRNASLALENCSLQDNAAAGSGSAGGSGGSVYGSSCNWILLKDTTILTSTAVRGHGGGIYSSGCGGVVLSNASLLLNNATGSGGAAYITASASTGGPSLVVIMGGNMSSNSAGGDGSSAAAAALSGYHLQAGSGGALYLGGSLVVMLDGSLLAGNTAARAAGALAVDLDCAQDTSAGSTAATSLFPLLSTAATSSSPSPSGTPLSSAVLSGLGSPLAELLADSEMTLQALARAALLISSALDCWPAVINQPSLWNNTAGDSGGGIYSSSPYTLTLLCGDDQSSSSGAAGNSTDSKLAAMLDTIFSASSSSVTNIAAAVSALSTTGESRSSAAPPPPDGNGVGISNSSANSSSSTPALYMGMLPSLEQVQAQCLANHQAYTAVGEVPANQARGGYGNEVATTPKQVVLSALGEYEPTTLTTYTNQKSANNLANETNADKSANVTNQAQGLVYGRLLAVQQTVDTGNNESANESAINTGNETEARWLRRAVLHVAGNIADECRPSQSCRMVLPTNVAVNLNVSVYDALGQLANDSSTSQPVVRVSMLNASDPSHRVDLLGNPTAQVDGGMASVSGVRMRALKGNYTLRLDLSNTGGVQVAPLVFDVTVPPCSLGEVVTDEGYLCSRCPANFFTLSVDLYSSNETQGGSCDACPDSAICTGGAVVVPLAGYWHSAANSTIMNACLNSDACRAGDDEANSALVRSQQRWYAYFGNPSRFRALTGDARGPEAVVTEYLDVWRRVQENATWLPYTPLLSANASDFDGFLLDCALWGLPDNHSASYMQMQCSPGYAGILCGTCTEVDGVTYALDTDLKCSPCFKKGLTVLISIIMLLINTLSVGLSAVMTYQEDFLDALKPKQAADQLHAGLAGYSRSNAFKRNSIAWRSDQGSLPAADVLKVLIVHFQFYIIVTRINLNWPTSVEGLQSVLGTITGIVKQVYSPSCLRPGADSAEQARWQLLAGLLLPIFSVAIVLMLWLLRWRFYNNKPDDNAPAMDRKRHQAPSRRLPQPGSKREAAGNKKETMGSAGETDAAGKDGLSRISSLKGSGEEDAQPQNANPGDGVSTTLYARNPRDTACMASTSAAMLDFASAESPSSPTATTSDGRAASGQQIRESAGMQRSSSASIGILINVEAKIKPIRTFGNQAFDQTQEGQAGGGRLPADLGLSDAPKPLNMSRPAGPVGEATESNIVPHNKANGAGDSEHPGDARDKQQQPQPPQQQEQEQQQQQQQEKESHPPPPPQHPLGTPSRRKLGQCCRWYSMAELTAKLFDDSKLPLGKQLFLALMVTCFILMPKWATEALSIFACYRLDGAGGGSSDAAAEYARATWKYGYWIRDMNQQCFTGRHLTLWVPIGIVSGAVLCLTMPILTAMLLYANRDRLEEPEVAQLYGFLFSTYKREYYYWEFISQAQTFMLVVVEVFGRLLPVYQQALLLQVVLLACLMLNTYVSPLRINLLNSLQLLSSGIICLTVSLGMFTTGADELQISRVGEVWLAVIILLLNGIIIFIFVVLVIYHAIPVVKDWMKNTSKWLERHGLWPRQFLCLRTAVGCFGETPPAMPLYNKAGSSGSVGATSGMSS